MIGGTFPGESHRVVTFTQPIEVSEIVYNNWLSICKRAEGTPYEVGYNEGVAAQPTPTIAVSSMGLITATAGEKSATKQLTTKGTSSFRPAQYPITVVPAGIYTTGDIKVQGDVKLYAANIRKNVEIFGVTGTFDNYELGRRHYIPEYVQSINQVSLSAAKYGASRGGYQTNCFRGEYAEPPYHTATLEYHETDFIAVSSTGSESPTFEITVINKHHTLDVIVFVDVVCNVQGDREDYFRAITVPPEGEASIEVESEYGSDVRWSYAIDGLCFK